MEYDEIIYYRDHHPTWRLLRADNAALVLSFCHAAFVESNSSARPAGELIDALDDHLYALNSRLGDGTFPRPARSYLDDWASGERGWLRKFYRDGTDEPFYDLVPAVEKAILWVWELRGRDFVGTESRLNTVFMLLREIVSGTDDDPESRLAELKARRAEIDAEIARAERGEIELLDDTAVRDRFQQFSRTARELLSDFREVEENFRQLDRNLREQIAGWDGSKGELLDEVFGSQASIAESDQGRSFSTFYDFLLSRQRQDELARLLSELASIEALDGHDSSLSRVHFDWIDASERTQTTVRLLSDQLRRFLDDQVWLENRRVVELLRSIERNALSLRSVDQPDVVMGLDSMSVPVNLPIERPLYNRSRTIDLDSSTPVEGDEEMDSAELFAQAYVDRDQLIRRVRRSLAKRDQVALADIVENAPLEQGLAELISYLALNEPGFSITFDDDRRDQIAWSSEEEETVRRADVAAATFTKDSARKVAKDDSAASDPIAKE